MRKAYPLSGDAPFTLLRLMDIVFSGGVLLLAGPVILLAAFAVSLDGGPVLYRQNRSGLRGRGFEILKLRSMRPNTFSTAELAAIHGQVTSTHPGVTTVGRWIRRFKIDELPQLMNVLRGDMSVIGPRPTVAEQVAEYTPYQLRRLDIRPGLTGWSQVNGGTKLSWRERILLDVWYVAHRSPWLDAKILFKTIFVVLFGEKRNPDVLTLAEAYARQQLGVRVLTWPRQDTLMENLPPDHAWSAAGLEPSLLERREL